MESMDWLLGANAPTPSVSRVAGVSRFCQLKFLSRFVLAVGSLAPWTASGQDFRYDVDLDLAWIDALAAPAGGTITQGDSGAATGSAGKRAFGLGTARFAGHWQAGSYASLTWILRPDALVSRTQPEEQSSTTTAASGNQEFDTRAGEVYQRPTQLSLLDAYEVSIHIPGSLRGWVGVAERWQPQRLAFPVALEFGLNVRFPERFWNLGLAWPSSQPANSRQTRGVSGRLMVLGDSADRHEAWVVQSETRDAAPGAADGRLGVAAELTWRTPWRLRVEGALGESTHRHGEAALRRSIFGTALLRLAEDDIAGAEILGRWRVLAAYRILEDQISEGDSREVSYLQQSGSLSASVRLTDVLWTAAAFQVGRAEHAHPVQATEVRHLDGSQVDLGLILAMHQDLDLGLFVARESRSQTLDGTKSPALGATTDPKGQAWRMAWRLGYHVSSF